MKSIQGFSDKLAISLSFLCAMHCLATPLVLVLLPSIAALQFNNEAFHIWMVTIVIPISIYALTMGCNQHKRYQLLALGGAGLAFLLLAVLLGETVIGEFWEKTLTLVGSILIIIGHYRNFRLCQVQESCCCHDKKAIASD